ncbi:MAG: hypothetical protein Q8Q60_00060 [Candidatus Chromulinivorax sp.]|nr:hypothetical protein [Candidatus Chromulinivorax sp.]
MNSINTFTLISLFCINYSLYASNDMLNIINTQHEALITIYEKNQQQWDTYKKAKAKFNEIKTDNLDYENSMIIEDWYGKHWEKLTEDEKSFYYNTECVDAYSGKTWETAAEWEKLKQNLTNKNRYGGQCRKYYTLTQDEKKILKELSDFYIHTTHNLSQKSTL